MAVGNKVEEVIGVSSASNLPQTNPLRIRAVYVCAPLQ